MRDLLYPAFAALTALATLSVGCASTSSPRAERIPTTSQTNLTSGDTSGVRGTVQGKPFRSEMAVALQPASGSPSLLMIFDGPVRCSNLEQSRVTHLSLLVDGWSEGSVVEEKMAVVTYARAGAERASLPGKAVLGKRPSEGSDGTVTIDVAHAGSALHGTLPVKHCRL